jgi:hypothetical protein
MSLFQKDETIKDGINNLTKLTARFMAYFIKQKKATQQQFVMNWYHAASVFWDRQVSPGKKGHIGKRFVVPVLSNMENNIVIMTPPFVCMLAMQLVCRKRVSFWRTCMRAVQNNTIPEHGLIGHPLNNNKFTEEMLDDLHAFFEEIKTFCDVIPTRFVRD